MISYLGTDFDTIALALGRKPNQRLEFEKILSVSEGGPFFKLLMLERVLKQLQKFCLGIQLGHRLSQCAKISYSAIHALAGTLANFGTRTLKLQISKPLDCLGKHPYQDGTLPHFLKPNNTKERFVTRHGNRKASIDQSRFG